MSDSPLTPTRLEKLQALFEKALEYPAAERSTFLESQTDEPELRDEVLALIRAHERGDTEFRSPVSASTLVDAATGEDRWIAKRVGAYRIKDRIGFGGMGVVYEASRDDEQYEKRVAVKFLHRHVGSDPAVARFRS
jgi:serine/threonine protein kinase